MLESVIARIRKLFAHSESAGKIGSAEEAAAFAAKANELLLLHKLSRTEVEIRDDEDNDPLGNEVMKAKQWGGSSAKWSRKLIDALARAHFCRVVFISNDGYKSFGVIGRASDREVCAYLVTTLHREAGRLARVYTANTADVRGSAPGTRVAFLMGFVDAVRVRLAERATVAKEAGGSMAVVRLNTIRAEVDAATAVAYPRVGSIRSRSSYMNPTDFRAGQQAGREVGMGGLNGPNKAIRRLSA